MTQPEPTDMSATPGPEEEHASDNVSPIGEAAAAKNLSANDVSGRDVQGQDQVSANSASMGMIMDIPVTVSMELGRARISIRELLSMNPGAVIELQRLASDPMEILVNGTLVAHGEAVRVGERYGVRVTSVVSPADRLKQVGG